MADARKGRGQKEPGKRKKLAVEQSEIRAKLTWAIAHRMRRQILRTLAESEGPRSPMQISRELGAGVSPVAYHVTILRRFGAIELAEEQMARGAVEHFYASKVEEDPPIETLLEETRLADEDDEDK
jgi:DNA-binding transcriptional ArsR family regulator